MPEGLFLTSLRQASSFAVCTLRDKCLFLETQYRVLDCPRLDFLSVFTGTSARVESRLRMYIKKKKDVGSLSEEYLRE